MFSCCLYLSTAMDDHKKSVSTSSSDDSSSDSSDSSEDDGHKIPVDKVWCIFYFKAFKTCKIC